MPENDTVNATNDTVNATNDTVNSNGDTLNTKDDTLNYKIISLINENLNITAREIADKLEISLSTVKRKIKAFKDNGIISRIGSDKTGRWQIVKYVVKD